MTKSIRNLIFAAASLLLTLILVPFLIESNTSGQTLVITYPNGTVEVFFEAGVHPAYFGSAVHYNKRGELTFEGDDAVMARFNDSGTARVSGTVQYELPTDTVRMKDLHASYQSPESIQKSLIKNTLNRAVFATGSLMSSTESYSIKRNDLFTYIREQVMLGVYLTNSAGTRTEKDATGAETQIVQINIARDPKTNLPVIVEKSPLERFGVTVQNISISGLEYDEKVKAQVAAQLDATIKVQTSRAEAERSKQDALTAVQKGLADKAVAEAEANVAKVIATVAAEKEKEVAITKGEQQKEVAQLALDAAKLEAQAKVELGKGDAEARKLVMEADGALEKKLMAWTSAQESWATAFSKIQVPVVPAVIMGGADGNANNSGLESMMQLMGAKMAKDLGVDLNLNVPIKKP